MVSSSGSPPQLHTPDNRLNNTHTGRHTHDTTRTWSLASTRCHCGLARLAASRAASLTGMESRVSASLPAAEIEAAAAIGRMLIERQDQPGRAVPLIRSWLPV